MNTKKKLSTEQKRRIVGGLNYVLSGGRAVGTEAQAERRNELMKRRLTKCRPQNCHPFFL